MNKLKLLVGLFTLLLSSASFAQFEGLGSVNGDEPVVTARAFLSVNGVPQGGEARLAVKATIADQWHINSFKPSDEFLIPTELSFEPLPGIEVSDVNYPLHELRKFSFSEDKLAVYTGSITLFATVTAHSDVPPGKYVLQGKLHYQACNDFQCLAPEDVQVELPVEVVQAGAETSAVNADIFSGASGRTSASAAANEPQESEISAWLSQKGWVITFFLIFVGGLALNLTPCVYPLIPITVSFFVNQAQGNLAKSFALSAVYILGMAITYSVLGLTAALSGGFFGAILQNPIALGFIALVLLVLASSMFGAFDIRVPQKLALLGGSSRQGLTGSLLMGLTVGIIAAPCIGPFVLSLLIFVGEKGDPVLGFTMFFTLSLGLGLPFLFLGAFSGSISKLPRSGAWMAWVKKVFGFVLVAMAIYFLEPLLSKTVYWGGMIATAVVGGVYLGWINKLTTQGGVFPWIKKGVGALAIGLAVFFALPQKAAPAIDWQRYDEALVAKSISEGRPVMIDFYADWCLPCKELDKLTFTGKKVIELSDSFLRLKADLTRENSPEVRKLRQQYNILGVPTIVFIDGSGQERKDLRLTGFLKAEAFALRLEKALKN
ncbi:MAG: cytochrome c biogenesis protein CcdA [bacterium]